jgi:hypothetical protein
MRYRTLILLLSLAGLAGCEATIDPATGQTQTQWTLPMTEANAEANEQQWQQCLQYASQSYCERHVAGGQPMPTAFGFIPRPNDP